MMTMAEKEAARAQVIKIGTIVSCCLFGLMGFLCCLSIFMPWWEGASSTAMLETEKDKSVTSATITLWSYDLEVQVGTIDEGPVSSEVHSSTWDTMCSLATEKLKEQPPECMQVQAIRAFAILPMLFGIFAVVPILLAKKVSPLLLLIGGGLGMLADLFAFLGMILGVMLSTDGLGGNGFMCILIAWLIGMVAIASTFFTAGKAMPPDQLPGAPVEVKVSRAEKAEAGRKKAAKEALELAKKFGGPGTDRSDASSVRSSHSGGSQRPSPVLQDKAPVMLQKVLFWSQEHDGDEPIPTELLEVAYREIDSDGSGTILLEELVEGLAKCGLNASPAAMESVMTEIDKNSDGTVDIHEFVEFFRRIEELSQFNKKSQQRAQFLVVVCNFCFLFHIIVVGVMLLVLIKSDPADNPDTYMIMRNGLMVFCVDLGVLFCCVILIPAGRLTVGENVKAWNAHYEAAIAAMRSVKPVSSNNSSGPGPRGAAWAAGGVTVGPPAVNAGKYGASYRVNKFQLQDAPDFDLEMPEGTLANFQTTQGSSNMHGNQFGSTRTSVVSHASVQSGGRRASVKADPGVILSRTGDFQRYEPSQYRLAAMNAIEHSVPASFTPMQVQNLTAPPSSFREDAPPGVPSLNDNDDFG